MCWYKVPHKPVHDPNDCEVCIKRITENKKYSDPQENVLEYRSEKDEEYMDMLETIKKIEKLNNKYTCETCQVKCFTEEFYNNHVNGRKHKANVGQKTTNNNNKTSAGKKRTATATATTNNDGDATPPPAKKPKKFSHVKTTDDETYDQCIRKLDNGSFQCVYCDMNLKYKRNLKNHLKTKKHNDSKKHAMETRDESVQPDKTAQNRLDDITFVRETEEGDKKSKKGNHFWIEFNKPVKYKIAQRVNKSLFSCEHCLKNFITQGAYNRHCSSSEHLRKKKLKLYGTRSTQKIIKRKEKMEKIIKQMAVCNEFSETKDKFTNSHSHMFVNSNEAYLFQDMKKLLKRHLGVKPNDISRPLNMRETIRYVTKQDQNSILINIPLKFTSTVYRARIYADQGHRTVTWSDYIPSQIAACERKVFEDLVHQETISKELQELGRRIGGIHLFNWQRDLLELVNEEDDDRKVWWLTDEVGGTGKSILAKHIVTCENGCLFHDTDYKSNAYLYNYETVVVFDLPRTCLPQNLAIIEDLKNGEVISTKYQPVRKRFPPPTIIVFSNHAPTMEHLSMDRWRIMRVNDALGNLIRTWEV